MDYSDWVGSRITELRLEKGVSARDMSLSLGQSESYINKIENKRTLPSLMGLFYICEYFDISPEEFFQENNKRPKHMEQLWNEFIRLSSEQQTHIAQIVSDFNKFNPRDNG